MASPFFIAFVSYAVVPATAAGCVQRRCIRRTLWIAVKPTDSQIGI